MELAIFDLSQVQAWMAAGGYVVLFALLFACGLGLPLPEDIPLLLAGMFVATGKMDLAIASICAWCGIIGGDIVLYHLGRRFGLNITRVRFVGRHLTRERIESAERLFERYGVWVVAVCRLFAGIRGAMVVAAGAVRFNFIKFVIADGVAALISGGFFVAVGYWFGSHLDEIRQRITQWEHVLLVGAVVAAVLIAGYVWWRRRKHKALTDAISDVVLEKAVEHVEHVEERKHSRESHLSN